ncbi:vesicle transport v-SNARE protein [Nitzschia inconspicua]|uniref:Vesicle transport v-SNARE protein n=1 Tax=Nitzschia inconspicua TaxID=303405 RepID=A0A9K3PTD2_9STRA|nr:vesicle transport v-SNARE protein [Nitzschia inconspicua]
MSQASLSFRRYDDEFKSLTKQIKASLQDAEQYHDEETGEGKNVSNMLSECDELLQQMALEARSVPDAAEKRELLQQVRTYKSELQSLKDDYNKQSLMSSARGNTGNGNQHRERLLKQQEMLQNQNSQLESARRVLEETEQVALEIGEELSNNRATIESAHGRVRQVSSLTGRAKRVVASMNQRATQQKMLMYGLFISVIIVFFIFLKWLR